MEQEKKGAEAMGMFCFKCGRQLQADAKFCDSCGTRTPKILMGLAVNTHQRFILLAVAVAMASMMLYPPYYYPRDPDIRTPTSHGYDWLLSSGFGRVEVDLLLNQFLVVVVIGLIAYFLCANKK